MNKEFKRVLDAFYERRYCAVSGTSSISQNGNCHRDFVGFIETNKEFRDESNKRG